MAIPLFTPLFLIGVLLIPALMIWALIDLMSRPSSEWEQADQDKMIWVLVVVFVGVIGPILYLTIGRSKLNSVVPAEPTMVSN